MLGAFADGVNVGAARGKAVIDHEATVDGQAGATCEVHIGADANGDHDKVGGKRAAVGELDRLYAPRPVKRSGCGIELDRDALAPHGATEQGGTMGIELPL